MEDQERKQIKAIEEYEKWLIKSCNQKEPSTLISNTNLLTFNPKVVWFFKGPFPGGEIGTYPLPETCQNYGRNLKFGT